MTASLRPADVCKALLAALEASEGRRRSRKRDQTPDAIGLRVKRELLERAVQENPNPEAFEQWLIDYPRNCELALSGPACAMARAVFDEWRLAHTLTGFRDWLDQGAPSDDVNDRTRNGRDAR